MRIILLALVSFSLFLLQVIGWIGAGKKQMMGNVNNEVSAALPPLGCRSPKYMCVSV